MKTRSISKRNGWVKELDGTCEEMPTALGRIMSTKLSNRCRISRLYATIFSVIDRMVQIASEIDQMISKSRNSETKIISSSLSIPALMTTSPQASYENPCCAFQGYIDDSEFTKSLRKHIGASISDLDKTQRIVSQDEG